jgi:hypothetical protein
MLQLMRAIDKLKLAAEIGVYMGVMAVMLFSLMLLSVPPRHF